MKMLRHVIVLLAGIVGIQAWAAPQRSAPEVVSWTSLDRAGEVIRHKKKRARIDDPATFAPPAGNWTMVPGLSGAGVSFESQDQPRRYLIEAGGEIRLGGNDGSTRFRQAATFLERPGLADARATSFESVSAPGKYMRHEGALLNVTAVNGDADKASATFRRSPPLATFSVQLEAEKHAAMQGMTVEACAEGGQDLAHIDAGDRAAYDIDLPTTGLYTVQYRVASPAGGGALQLEKAGGNPVYGNIDIPATGGWQSWTTISQQVQLPAGRQQIAFKALAGGWNINWLKISQ